ncbi:MAG: hypothetical protein R3F62_29590 [Planctomycetota bacterium]
MVGARGLSWGIALALVVAANACAQGRPPFYRVIDSWLQQDLSAAERFCKQVDPGTPARIAAEGVVAAMRGEFKDAQAKLQAVQREVGDYLIINEIHALCCAMNGDFVRARQVLGEDDDGVRALRMAVEGPFWADVPHVAPLLERRSPSGRYRIVSDVGLGRPLPVLEQELAAADPAAREALAKRIAGQHKALDQLGEIMDKAFTNFERMFGELRHVDGVATVFVFADRKRFETFRGAFNLSSEHVAGTYFPIARTLVFYADDSPEDLAATGLEIGLGTLKVLLHESFHQYLHLCVDRVPPWLNEGLAEYFGNRLSEEILAARDPAAPKAYPDRLKDVVFLREKVPHMAPVLPLEDLLDQNQAEFMSSPQRAFTNYAQSWVFVHFLASSPPGRGHLMGYLRGLRDGDSAPHLNGKLLGMDDQRAMLERGWRRHAGKLHKHYLDQDPGMAAWFEEQMEKLRERTREGGDQ